MGAEIIEIVEVVNQPMVNSWLTSLKTTGLIVVAFAAITITLAKTGVFNKILDWMIQKKGLSTGFNKEVLKKIEDTLDRLLENDKRTKDQMTALEGKVEKNTETIKEVKTDLKVVKIESVKKSIFHKGLFLIDRMAAGIRYLLEGGNSEVQNYLLNQLCFEDLATWDGLCKAMGAAQFWRNEKDRPENWKSELHNEVKNENRQQ